MSGWGRSGLENHWSLFDLQVRILCAAPKNVSLTQWGECHPYKMEVVGSSPTGNTIWQCGVMVAQKLAKLSIVYSVYQFDSGLCRQN